MKRSHRQQLIIVPGNLGLTALRNQLTVRNGEFPIAAGDERLLLAKEWLSVDPGAQDIFIIWQSANPVCIFESRFQVVRQHLSRSFQRHHALSSVIAGLLSSLLDLLSTHYTYYAVAQPVVKTLLSPLWMHRLNTYLSGSHTELVLVTLKLFNSLVWYAGGQERRAVFESFAWEIKVSIRDSGLFGCA